MPKGYKTCKVCGERYEYCRSAPSDPNMFRWQDVACCQEHGAIYLAQVLKARGLAPDTEPAAEEAAAEDAAPKKKSRKKKTGSDEPVKNEEMA